MLRGTLVHLIPRDGDFSKKIRCPWMTIEDFNSTFLSRNHLFSSPMTTKRLDMILKIVGSNQFAHIKVKMKVFKIVPTAPGSSRDRCIWCLVLLGGCLNQGWR